MRLIEINWHPTPRQLRQFAVASLVALPLICWFWSSGNVLVTAAGAATGILLSLLGVVYPPAIRPVFIALSVAATPVGFVVGEFSVLVIYFGVFLPIGLAFRLMRRDALQRDFDRGQTSYWQVKKGPTGPASYYRQS